MTGSKTKAQRQAESALALAEQNARREAEAQDKSARWTMRLNECREHLIDLDAFDDSPLRRALIWLLERWEEENQ